jgi:hypothetical protein
MPKPPFDPSKPFNSAEEKPAFNKNQPYQSAGESSDSDSYLERGKKFAVEHLPEIGGIAGGILGTPFDLISGPAGSVAGAGLGGAAGQAAKDYLSGYKDDAGNDLTTNQKILRPVTSGGLMAAGEGIGSAAAPYISKAVGSVAGKVSEGLSSMAEKKMIQATGATGKQASEFAPEAGRYLLDNGINKFGRSQPKIAEKISEALDESGKNIGKTLSDLDSRGATVDQADIINSLRTRASELSQEPHTFGVSDSLTKMADRLQTVLESGGGNSEIPLSKAENVKRGFDYVSNYHNSHPLDVSTSKEAASIYRKAVEDAASKFDPSAANTFQDAKKSFSILNPISEAANRRAMTTAQSPAGGLLDTLTTGVGAKLGGPAGAMVAAPIRRGMASRITPSVAATADAASSLVSKAPGIAQSVSPAAAQILLEKYGLLAPPLAPPPPSVNYSTVPGRNGQ